MKTSHGLYQRWHKYDKPYLERLRKRLEAYLGNKCCLCGLCRNDGVNLEFHHKYGKNYTANKLSLKQRLLRYKKEIDELVLLCAECHAEVHSKKIEIPF